MSEHVKEISFWWGRLYPGGAPRVLSSWFPCGQQWISHSIGSSLAGQPGRCGWRSSARPSAKSYTEGAVALGFSRSVVLFPSAGL